MDPGSLEWRDKKTAANLSAWFLAPHPNVAPVAGSILNANAGIDFASKAGCKSQSYTSWASFARSYVCGFYQKPTSEADRNTNKRVASLGVKVVTKRGGREEKGVQSDAPTTALERIPRALWDILDVSTRQRLESGELMEHHGLLITPEQAMMVRNMSLSEYTLWMMTQYEQQSTRNGVKDLGPDKLGVRRTYSLIMHDLDRSSEHVREKRSAKKGGSTTHTSTKTAGSTSTAQPTTSKTTQPQENTQRLDSFLGNVTYEPDEMDALLSVIEARGLTAEELATASVYRLDVERAQSDSGAVPSTSSEYHPPPTLLPYSQLMQKMRARAIEQYYTMNKQDRLASIPVNKPLARINEDQAARRLQKFRQNIASNLPNPDSVWKRSVTDQSTPALKRKMINKSWPSDIQPTGGRSAHNNSAGGHAMPHVISDNADNESVIDNIPMRAVYTTTYPGLYEQPQAIPFSPIFSSLSERLSDPTQVGTLGAVVRSANIRDATSILSLVKAIRTNPGSVMDIAPMLRLALMHYSLNYECAETDPTPSQFSRNAYSIQTAVRIVPVPGNNLPGGRIVAMPLDTYITFMSNGLFPPNMVNGVFTPNGADTTWTAVPIRSGLIGQTPALAYIMSFTTSRYWMGSVNWQQTMQYLDPRTGEACDMADPEWMILGGLLTMPASAVVDIPGQANVILVLTDVTSANATPVINIEDEDIPVWTGLANMQTADLQAMWGGYWIDRNLQRIRRDLVLAYNEVSTRLGVLNSASIALSLAAEMTMAARPGIAVKTMVRGNIEDYDLKAPCGGCWTAFDGNDTVNHQFPEGPHPILPDLTLYAYARDSNEYTHLGRDPRWRERHFAGFNQAALSSHHLTPSGYCSLIQVGEDGVPNRDGIRAYVDVHTYKFTPTYSVTVASALMRVATYVGLIDTQADSLQFRSSQALAAWLHMLSVAQAANTSAFLVTNNLTTAIWSGQQTSADDMFGTQLLTDAKNTLFSHFVIHNKIYESSVCGAWDYWHPESILQFYGFNPNTSIDWMSASPVPIHLTIQWVKKLSMDNYPALPDTVWARYNEHNIRAIPVRDDVAMTKLMVYSTIDFVRYRTRMLYMGTANINMAAWVDSYSFTSLYYSGAPAKSTMDYFASATTTITPNRVNLPYIDQARVFVLDSTSENRSAPTENISVSAIVYPDPPDFETILRAAKNYILGPATAGLMGMLSAGPPGAAIGAGSELAKQAMADILASRREEEKRQTADAEAKKRLQEHLQADHSAATPPTGREDSVPPSAVGPQND